MTPGPKTFLFSIAEAEKAVRSDNNDICLTLRTPQKNEKLDKNHETR